MALSRDQPFRISWNMADQSGRPIKQGGTSPSSFLFLRKTRDQRSSAGLPVPPSGHAGGGLLVFPARLGRKWGEGL